MQQAGATQIVQKTPNTCAGGGGGGGAAAPRARRPLHHVADAMLSQHVPGGCSGLVSNEDPRATGWALGRVPPRTPTCCTSTPTGGAAAVHQVQVAPHGTALARSRAFHHPQQASCLQQLATLCIEVDLFRRGNRAVHCEDERLVRFHALRCSFSFSFPQSGGGTSLTWGGCNWTAAMTIPVTLVFTLALVPSMAWLHPGVFVTRSQLSFVKVSACSCCSFSHWQLQLVTQPRLP
jgi:hypothetical protein